MNEEIIDRRYSFFADPTVAVVEIIFLLELIIEFKPHLVLFMMLSPLLLESKWIKLYY